MLSLSQRPLGSSDADHRLFVDRNSELDRVKRSPSLGLKVYVYGVRGMGKTTFLNQVQRSHPGAHYCRIKDSETSKKTLVELERVVGGQSGYAETMAMIRTLTNATPEESLAQILRQIL